jgi:hypothetical protein
MGGGWVPFVVCEMNESMLARFGGSQKSLRTRMKALGYDTFIMDYEGRMPTLIPPQTNIVPDAIPFNVLFSRVREVGQVWPEQQVA